MIILGDIMKLKLLLLLPMLFVQTACASNSAQEYYAAVKASQDAQTMIAAARYQALAQMAQSGEPGAATAATMAIALSQTPTVTPQYIESNALKWAQVLTPTIGTLGLGALNAAVSMNASDNAMEVQMASFATNEAIQLGNQNMVTNLGSSWAGAAAAGGTATVDVALAGFNALNTAGDQTVAVANTGFDTTTTIAGYGFSTVDSVATTGMDNLNEMGQFGMTSVGAVATAGFDSITSTAKWGMEGIYLTGSEGMTHLTNLGTHGIDAVGTVGTTGMNLLGEQSTNYAQIIADLQATINATLNPPATP